MNFYQMYLGLCNAKGLTPSKAALNMGISKTSVSRWKKGYNPTDINLKKVADYFGVTVDYFKKDELPDKAEQSAEDLAEINEMVSQISRLSDEERKIVDDLLAVLLAKHE